MAFWRTVYFLAVVGLLPAIVDVVLPHIDLVAVRHTNGDGLVIPSRLAKLLVGDVLRGAIVVDLDLKCIASAVNSLVEGCVVEAAFATIIGCRGFVFLLFGRSTARSIEGMPVLVSVRLHGEDLCR